MFPFALAVFLLFGGARAIADAPPSLFELTSIVLSNHPMSSALQADVTAARALTRQAGYRPNPEAEFSAGLKDADDNSGYEAAAALLFPIESAGKREARVGLIESETDIASAEWAQFQRDIELQVRSLGYAFLSATVDAQIAQEIAERSRAMIDLLKQRPVAGPAMLLELRVIEASLVEFQKSARDFSAQRDAARSELNLLLNRSPDAELRIRDALEIPAATFDLAALQAGLDRNPLVLKRLAETRRAGHEAEAARLEPKGDFSVGPYVAREEAGDAETTIGLAISMPLAWRNRNEGGVAAAGERRQGAVARMAAEKLAAQRELARLHRLYEAAVEQARAIPLEEVQRLHDAADLADRQYRLGAIPVQLFLDMQREFLNVQLLRHNALLEALVKDAELHWIAGPAAREETP